MKNVLLSFLSLLILGCSACEERQKLSDEGVLVPLTVMEDPLLPFIIVNNVKLHAEAFGNPDDPIVVVIHGGPGVDYRGQLNFKELVSDSLYVVFYDQMGSGLSQRLGKDHYKNVQVFIDELDGVINHYRQNSQQKVILAGHSWGGMLATAYFNQNPDKIDGAILAEPGGFNWEQTEAYLSRSRKIELFGESTNDFVYLDQFITGSDHNTLDYKMVLSLASDVATGDVDPPPFWRYGWICNSASIELAINHPEQLDFTANLTAFTPKVLFAYSELNESYGPDHAKLVSGFLSNVELVEIEGCGHEIPEYGWANFYPAVKKYLQEIL